MEHIGTCTFYIMRKFSSTTEHIMTKLAILEHFRTQNVNHRSFVTYTTVYFGLSVFSSKANCGKKLPRRRAVWMSVVDEGACRI